MKIIFVILGIVFVGCTRMYSLPDAAPKSEWVSVKVEDESAEERESRSVAAKYAAVEAFSLLMREDWKGALERMSTETRSFLEAGSGGEGAESVLAKGELQINGKVYSFDPVSEFFIAELSDIRDSYGEEQENESKKRKEFFAIDESGQVKKIVMIQEGEAWLLHHTSIRGK